MISCAPIILNSSIFMFVEHNAEETLRKYVL